jgi:hypothetical protein
MLSVRGHVSVYLLPYWVRGSEGESSEGLLIHIRVSV